MITGRKVGLVLFQLMFIAAVVFGQNYDQNKEQTQKYVTDELYQENSKHDVSGKWLGTEIQYDETGTFVKIKFDIVFDFVQQGNKVTGTSYIKDKLHEDVGYMNIRGYVIGDKLHFEEYELTDQKWETPNRVWCFRTGELDISKKRRKLQLTGDYEAYAAYDYRPCKDYCYTVVEKDATEDTRPEPSADLKLPMQDENLILIAPNPFRDLTTISYTLSYPVKVKLEVFDLSGRKVAELVNGSQDSGKYSETFEAGDNPPGSYIVRLLVGKELFTRQVVLMR
ncbi:MAG: T9SS type A sorting domain-containing protein [Flavobacteriales bacterium]|nr:T9SS type A sorting domain-containing protein [Flavobacteriales bacterium]